MLSKMLGLLEKNIYNGCTKASLERLTVLLAELVKKCECSESPAFQTGPRANTLECSCEYTVLWCNLITR